MCNAFSCIATKNHQILRHKNPRIHSHELQIKFNKLKELKHEVHAPFVRVEITPENDKYNTNPDSWNIKVDEISIPSWYEDDESTFEKLALDSCKTWWKDHVDKNGCYITEEEDSNGVLTRQCYYKNGQLHSPDNKTPAWQTWYGKVLIEQCYYKNGQLHSPDNKTPASQLWNSDGVLIEQFYYKDGQLHSPNKKTPAYQAWNDKGVLTEQCYYKDGQYHSPNNKTAFKRWNDKEVLTERRKPESRHRYSYSVCQTSFGPYQF